MGECDESIDRLAADTLGRAVGAGVIRVLKLELLEFFEQPIEFCVGHYWGGIDVVRAVRLVQQLLESVHPLDGLGI